MGGTSWDDSHYSARTSYRSAKKLSAFAYSDSVKTDRTKGVHEKLDPKKFKNDIRECRDSEDHPNSKPVFIGLDVTGSMRQVPVTVQSKLPQLMGLLIRKGYLDHPAICMGGIGDAKSDRVPMQIGQFESGIEIDDDITNLFLEGNGGSNYTESYELALYFLARCVQADEFDKRGGKGYAFIIGDEKLAGEVSAKEVEKVFGHKLQANIPMDELMAEVLEKWELFNIVPNMTSYYRRDEFRTEWKKYLDQRVLMLDTPEDISEFISSVIGVNEGNVEIDDLAKDLVDVGVSASSANTISKSLTVFENVNVSNTGLTKL